MKKLVAHCLIAVIAISSLTFSGCVYTQAQMDAAVAKSYKKGEKKGNKEGYDDGFAAAQSKYNRKIRKLENRNEVLRQERDAAEKRYREAKSQYDVAYWRGYRAGIDKALKCNGKGMVVCLPIGLRGRPWLAECMPESMYAEGECRDRPTQSKWNKKHKNFEKYPYHNRSKPYAAPKGKGAGKSSGYKSCFYVSGASKDVIKKVAKIKAPKCKRSFAKKCHELPDGPGCQVWTCLRCKGVWPFRRAKGRMLEKHWSEVPATPSGS